VKASEKRGLSGKERKKELHKKIYTCRMELNAEAWPPKTENSSVGKEGGFGVRARRVFQWGLGDMGT